MALWIFKNNLEINLHRFIAIVITRVFFWDLRMISGMKYTHTLLKYAFLYHTVQWCYPVLVTMYFLKLYLILLMLGYFDILRYFKYLTRQKYVAVFLENDLMIIHQRYNTFNRGCVISQKLFSLARYKFLPMIFIF